jgi:hypothetical protein
MQPVDYILPVLIELIGVACIVHLWVRPERKHVVLKLFWSLAVMVPLVGPLFYGAVYNGWLERKDGVDAASSPALDTTWTGGDVDAAGGPNHHTP